MIPAPCLIRLRVYRSRYCSSLQSQDLMVAVISYTKTQNCISVETWTGQSPVVHSEFLHHSFWAVCKTHYGPIPQSLFLLPSLEVQYFMHFIDNSYTVIKSGQLVPDYGMSTLTPQVIPLTAEARPDGLTFKISKKIYE